MRINIIDASNYFKGLLLLIRKDRQLTPPEINLMKSVGKSLGFEKEFCENAIEEILDNEYIEDVPPVFSTKELAVKFLHDGLSLALIDHDQIHPEEERWLKSIAEKNGIALEYFTQQAEQYRNTRSDSPHLEVLDFTVEYY